MDSFLTYPILVTLFCATGFTMLLTQILKDIWPFKKRPVRVLSYISALVAIAIASAVFRVLGLDNIWLVFTNAIFISFASNGIFDVIRKIFK